MHKPMNTYTWHSANCDGSGPHSDSGPTRRLPTGGDGAAILCHACYLREMAFRRERNRALAEAAKFALPEWAALDIVARPEEG